MHKGLSTYLISIGRKCTQAPFRAKLSGSEFSRLPLSVQKKTKSWKKQELKCWKVSWERSSSQVWASKERHRMSARKGSAQRAAQVSRKQAWSTNPLWWMQVLQRLGEMLKQQQNRSIGSRTTPKRPQPRRKNVKGILRLQEVRVQSEENMKAVSSVQGKPVAEPIRSEGRSYQAAAYSRNGSHFWLARRKVSRVIKRFYLPPKHQPRFITQGVLAEIMSKRLMVEWRQQTIWGEETLVFWSVCVSYHTLRISWTVILYSAVHWSESGAFARSATSFWYFEFSQQGLIPSNLDESFPCYNGRGALSSSSDYLMRVYWILSSRATLLFLFLSPYYLSWKRSSSLWEPNIFPSSSP